MEKTEETTYGYSEEIQKKIIAMMLFDKAAFVENLEIIQPKFFDNPILEALAEIIKKFYEKYHKAPTQEEFIQEADTLVDSNKKLKLPRKDVGDIIGEILTFGVEETFEYVKDKAREFAKFQAVRAALLESAETLQKSQDYAKINQRINEALLIGESDLKRHKLRSPVTAMEEEEEEEEIIVMNWADKLTVSLVAGETKVGKSLLCLQLGTCLATGQDFLGFHVPRKQRVLYIQQEIKERDIKRRWKAAAHTITAEQRKALAENFKYVTTTGHPLKLTEPKDKAKIFELVKDAQPDLTMLDHLRTFHNEKENDSGKMSIVFDHVQELMNTFNTAVLLVHHFRKEGNFESSSIDKVRGSTVITDRPDFIITVQKLNKKYKRDPIRLPQFYDNYAELSFENRSWAKPANMLVERDEATLIYRESNLYAQLGIKLTAEDVRKIVEEAGGEILQKEVLEMLLEKVSRETAYKNIFAAVEKGYITRKKLPTKGSPRILRLVDAKQ